ncbi:MAG: hypothetical protein H0V03_09280 [Thermoleophilaceae bacterium]|nr:hypothetical protein [Thermoleophilaceae bacterium]
MAGYSLTIRERAKVERDRFEDLGTALSELELRGRSLQEGARARPIDLPTRHFEPIQQVVARLELVGPRRLRVGIDVRGDGSAEGWTGRVRRRLIEQRERESAYDALRRAIDGTGEAGDRPAGVG